MRYGGTSSGSLTRTSVKRFKVNENGHTLKYVPISSFFRLEMSCWAFQWTLHKTRLVLARERPLGNVVVFKGALLSGNNRADEVALANVRPKISSPPNNNLLMCAKLEQGFLPYLIFVVFYTGKIVGE